MKINTNKVWHRTLMKQQELLQRSIQSTIQAALNEQFNKFIGAGLYERTEDRRGQRNGFYERSLTTRVGTITLQVCRDREGEFSPDVFVRYERNEQALVLTIIDMYISGTSTRKVTAVVETLCGKNISKSVVSSLTTRLDEEIAEWRARLLTAIYLYLMVDARYEKVREGGRVVSKAFVTIIGITTEGFREIIGTYVINSESFDEWDGCFTDLKKRGLKDVVYAVSDENLGLVKAIKKHFQGIQWQRCQVHFTRNLLSKVAQQDKTTMVDFLRDVFDAPSKQTASQRSVVLADFLRTQKREKVAQWLEENIEDTFAAFDLPKEHQKKMRSTNMIERLNQELKRRSRVIRIFPNEESCLRVLTTLCMDISEKWHDWRFLKM